MASARPTTMLSPDEASSAPPAGRPATQRKDGHLSPLSLSALTASRVATTRYVARAYYNTSYLAEHPLSHKSTRRHTHIINHDARSRRRRVDDGLTAPSWKNTSTITTMPEIKTLKRATFRTGCVAAAIVLAANYLIGVFPRAGMKTTTSTHRNGFSAMFGHFVIRAI